MLLCSTYGAEDPDKATRGAKQSICGCSCMGDLQRKVYCASLWSGFRVTPVDIRRGPSSARERLRDLGMCSLVGMWGPEMGVRFGKMQAPLGVRVMSVIRLSAIESAWQLSSVGVGDAGTCFGFPGRGTQNEAWRQSGNPLTAQTRRGDFWSLKYLLVGLACS
jgi:hypothetical protein